MLWRTFTATPHVTSPCTPKTTCPERRAFLSVKVFWIGRRSSKRPGKRRLKIILPRWQLTVPELCAVCLRMPGPPIQSTNFARATYTYIISEYETHQALTLLSSDSCYSERRSVSQNCHPDRSAAKWRDLQFNRSLLEMFLERNTCRLYKGGSSIGNQATTNALTHLRYEVYLLIRKHDGRRLNSCSYRVHYGTKKRQHCHRG